MLTLPVELEQAFRRDLAEYEEARRMPYITSIERAGIEQGILLRSREDVIEVLRLRFPDLPQQTSERVERIQDDAFLRALLRAAATAESLAEFSAVLEEGPPGDGDGPN